MKLAGAVLEVLAALVRDIAQELGVLAEGSGNLDPLAGAGAAVALADAVLAVLALDRGCPGSAANSATSPGPAGGCSSSAAARVQRTTRNSRGRRPQRW